VSSSPFLVLYRKNIGGFQEFIMQKYTVLAVSVLIQTCLGGIYAWSAFVPSLRADYGLSTGATQLVFGVLFVGFTLAMIPAGIWLSRTGPRRVAMTGGVLFGLGFVVASYSNGSFPVLLAGIGLITGAGVGFGYVCPIAACIRWFPDRKGLVTGIAVAGFGGGSIILSEIGDVLIDRGMDVLLLFRYMGVVYTAVIIGAAALLFSPPREEHHERVVAPSIRSAMGTRHFWLLSFGLFAGTFTGLLAIGNLKPIGLAGGISDHLATLAIAALAVGNVSGRIGWGLLADRLGPRSLTLKLSWLSCAALLMIPASHHGLAFLLVAAAIGFGFGGCFVLYAASVAHLFGPAAVTSIYPIVFLSYAVSGLCGPTLGGWLYDTTGSYLPSLTAACILAAVGAAVHRFAGQRSW